MTTTASARTATAARRPVPWRTAPWRTVPVVTGAGATIIEALLTGFAARRLEIWLDLLAHDVDPAVHLHVFETGRARLSWPPRFTR